MRHRKKGTPRYGDLYALTRFLAKHTQTAVKVEGTKEWIRTNGIVDPAVEEYEAGRHVEIKQPGQEQPEMTDQR